MKDRYPYLKDPRAVAEIRKHKWIESQKTGAEIGFATAAVDWVNKYGTEWKKIHAEEADDKKIFLERRRYRRFKLRGVAQLKSDRLCLTAEPLDLSFFGVLCRVDQEVPLGGEIKVSMSVETNRHKEDLDCCGSVERVLPVDGKRYDLFFSFHESCRRKLGSLTQAL